MTSAADSPSPKDSNSYRERDALLSASSTHREETRDAESRATADDAAEGADVAATTPDLQLPDYDVIRLLGRGGMGTVYLAKHRELRRLAAIKLLSGPSDADAIARMRREAEAIARLQHPHIVQLYEIREHQERTLLIMEYVAGGSLSERARRRAWEPQAAAEMMVVIARAVHRIHDARLVHRDLKPSNVLITEDGQPKIADFGLARFLDEPSHTRPGTILGTPAYMAPEQVSELPAEPHRSMDVYALGAMFYEMLTGSPPFIAPSVLSTLDLIRYRDPIPPRQLLPHLPRDLETVLLKCLRKTPNARYGTAEAFADDLERFLQHRPILARPVSFAERLAKWCRRHPWPAALIGVNSALLLTIAILGLVLAVQYRSAAESEEYLRKEIVSAIVDTLPVVDVLTPQQAAVVTEAQLADSAQRLARLVEQAPGDAQIRFARARVLLSLAIEQIKSGKADDARKSLTAAAQENAELLAGSSDPAVWRDAQWLSHNVGVRRHQLGDVADALQLYQQSQAICRQLEEREAASSDTQLRHSEVLNSIAHANKDQWLESGDSQFKLTAGQQFEDVLAMRRQMQFDSDQERLEVIADALQNLGAFYTSTGQSDLAEQRITESLELRHQLLQLQPSEGLQEDIASDYQNLLLSRVQENKSPERWREWYSNGYEMARGLRDRHPREVDYHGLVGRLDATWGWGAHQQAQHDEAVRSFDRALPELSYVVVRQPDDLGMLVLLQLSGDFRRAALAALEKPDEPPAAWAATSDDPLSQALADAEYGVMLAATGYSAQAREWMDRFRTASAGLAVADDLIALVQSILDHPPQERLNALSSPSAE